MGQFALRESSEQVPRSGERQDGTGARCGSERTAHARARLVHKRGVTKLSDWTRGGFRSSPRLNPASKLAGPKPQERPKPLSLDRFDNWHLAQSPGQMVSFVLLPEFMAEEGRVDAPFFSRLRSVYL